EWYDPDGVLRPMISVISGPAGPTCGPDDLATAVRGYDRVIAYSGARLSPYKETYRYLAARLASLGTVTRVAHLGTEGLVWVVDLTRPPAAGGVVAPSEEDCLTPV